MTFSCRASVSISCVIAQSVVMKDSMVPMFGWIMPLPLQMPPMRQVLPPTVNSTNDMCVVLANGLAGNELIDWQNEDYQAFCKALNEINTRLARQIAADGEGATKLVTCTVKNSRSEETAERLAKAVVGSNLVKAAMFGADANWGRVLCAMGYSKAPFRPEYVDVAFESENGSVAVCEKGAALNFDEELAKKVLTANEVTIQIDVHEGEHAATAWGCDLTYDYVKINGDYRT